LRGQKKGGKKIKTKNSALSGVPGADREAELVIVKLRKDFNQIKPHSSLGYRPAVPEATQTVSLSYHFLVFVP
jgi:hypothetical protein